MWLVGAVWQRAWSEANFCWRSRWFQRPNGPVRKLLVIRNLWVWVSSAKCWMETGLAGSLPGCLPAASRAGAGYCAASGSSVGDRASPCARSIRLPSRVAPGSLPKGSRRAKHSKAATTWKKISLEFLTMSNVTPSWKCY